MNKDYKRLEKRVRDLEVACEYSKSFNRGDIPSELPTESRAFIIRSSIKEAEEIGAKFNGELDISGKTISGVLEKDGKRILSHSKIYSSSFSPYDGEKIIFITLENGNEVKALLKKPNISEMFKLKEAIVVDENLRTRWKADESLEKVFSMLEFFPRVGEREITVDDLSLESADKLAQLGGDLTSVDGINKHFPKEPTGRLNFEGISPEVKTIQEVFRNFMGREATPQEIEQIYETRKFLDRICCNLFKKK